MSRSESDSELPDELESWLERWQAGDKQAESRLTELLYQRLHQLAVQRMRLESRQITLQPTVLVHEVVLRLLAEVPTCQDRQHLLALAARMMRHYLANEANRRLAWRHGGQALHVTLDGDRIGSLRADIELIELEQILERLDQIDPRKARIVELHYFGGLDYEEMAAQLGISRATVHRELRFARAYIAAELGPQVS